MDAGKLEEVILEGGCYCGEVRYRVDGDVLIKGQCHCRECQTISGGAPGLFMGIAQDGFTYIKGQPKTFARSDLENPVIREFCADCGTHLTSLRPGGTGWVILKIGTLDDPSVFGQAQIAIFTKDKQPFHMIADGIATFEGLPPRE